jgi:purine-nucleoside/S-methyl-5'-thioadenosine phosphorylase / adenosine deaminase
VSARPDAPDGAAPARRVPAWDAIPGLAHGFFGRHGGVSGGLFAALNASDRVGDDPAAVAANWRSIGRALPGLSFVRMRQVHGVSVVRVDDAHAPAGDADGMITAAVGAGLTILTADCVPLLCVAPAEHAVMVLHAGWRGTLAGIAAAGLAAAQRELGIGAGAWRVAMGPSIGGCCYEVEGHVGQQFVDRWGALPDAWQPAGTHGQLDLRAVNRHILVARGVRESQIVDAGECTSCRSDDYFSHRRSGGRTGRQVSVIGWVR